MVELGGDNHRNVGRDVNGLEEAYAAVSESYAESASHQRQHQTFDEELANQTQAADPDGESNGDLARTRAGSRQKKIGDVGASDDEHEPYQCHEHGDQGCV